MKTSLRLAFIGMVMVSAGLERSARAEDLVECPGCGTNDMKEFLALGHGTYRSYFDVVAGWVRTFQASGCNYEGTNWMSCVTEVTPWWTTQQSFASMRTLQ